MIQFFRSIFQSKIGLLITFAFVALIAVAFATADVSNSGAFGGVTGSGTAVTVGESKLTTAELEESINNAFQAAQRQNPTLDMKTFVEQGGFDDVLERLINSFAIAEFGRKYDMTAGKRLVDSEISSIPAFQGADGRFSEELFRRALQQQGVSETTLRNDLFRTLMAEQILPAARFGTSAPKKMVTPYAGLLLERRKGRIALIPSLAFAPEEKPSDEEVEKYFKANSEDYQIPERRSARYALIDTGVLAGRVKVSDEEIRNYYDLNKKKYAARELRELMQVIVPTKAAATTLAKRVRNGESLSKVATEAGFSAADIRERNKADLADDTSQAVADAVFATKEGGVAEPAQSGFGWHVVQVRAVRKVPAVSVADARADIERTLKAEKTDAALADLISRIEDEIGSGSTIAEIAKAEGLKLQSTPPLLADGRNVDNPDYKPVPEMQRILPAIFAMEEDADPQLVEVAPNSKYAIAAIGKIEPAAPPPLEEIEQLVLRDYVLSTGNAKAEKIAKQVVKSIREGTSLSAALGKATDKRMPPPQAIDNRRTDLARLAKEKQGVPPPLSLMFAMSEGSAKTLKAPRDQGWLIVILDDIIEGDASDRPDLVESASEQFNRFLGQEYAFQFIAAMKADVGVERNDSAIKALKDRLSGRGSR